MDTLLSDLVLSDLLFGYSPISATTSTALPAPFPYRSPQPDPPFDTFPGPDNMLEGGRYMAQASVGRAGQHSPLSTPFHGFHIPTPCPQARLSDIRRTVLAQDSPNPEPPQNIAASSFAHPSPVSLSTQVISEVPDIASPDGRRPCRHAISLPEKPPKGGWMYRCQDPSCVLLKPMKPSAFQQHLRVHTGERPYVCEFCGSGFPKPFNRKRHQTTCKAAKRALESVQYPSSDVTSSP